MFNIKPKPTIYCPKCKQTSQAKVRRKMWVTIIIVVFAFPIGILYLFVPKYQCRQCKNIYGLKIVSKSNV